MSISSYIRTIPDFPKKGVQFRDVSTLFLNPVGWREVVDTLVARYKDSNISTVAVIEARGFLVGGALAYQLGCGVLLLRKKGKLPGSTRGVDYVLEYGADRIEVHDDAITPGERILLIDDLIATGGTAEAAVTLLEESGAIVHELAFLVDLPYLGGAQKIRDKGYSVFAMCSFGE